MSAVRKNARRLRDLRFHGVPINGDSVMGAEWGAMDEGERINVGTQKNWLAQLGVPRRGITTRQPIPRITKRGMRRGRLA